MSSRKTVALKRILIQRNRQIQDFPGWVFSRTARQFRKRGRTTWRRSRIFR